MLSNRTKNLLDVIAADLDSKQDMIGWRGELNNYESLLSRVIYGNIYGISYRQYLINVGQEGLWLELLDSLNDPMDVDAEGDPMDVDAEGDPMDVDAEGDPMDVVMEGKKKRKMKKSCKKPNMWIMSHKSKSKKGKVIRVRGSCRKMRSNKM